MLEFSFLSNTPNGLGEVHSFPIYLSPTGLVATCLGWAAQNIIDHPVDNPVLTEWYIFREESKDGDVEYYGLEQSPFGSKLKVFRKSELMKIPFVELEEDVRNLHQLQPPEEWVKVG